MQSSKGIQERIDHLYSSLRPAEQSVARYVRDHAEQAAGLTVGQLADATHVSQPTVIRFSRKLGFSGYRELRYMLGHPSAEQTTVFNPLGNLDLNPWNDINDVPDKTTDSAKAVLDELRNCLDPKALNKAAAYIAQAETIDIYAEECSIAPAIDLRTSLSYLGLRCRLDTVTHLQRLGACHLEHGDTAIAFSRSGTASDAVASLRLAQSRGARTIAITGSTDTPLSGWTDVTLPTGNGHQTITGNAAFAHIADIALVNMLSISVILSDYGRFSTALNESCRTLDD